MGAKEKAKRLANYIRGLKNFKIVREKYCRHMGAILVDAILQAGANYDAVKQRVDHIKKFSAARTTAGLIALAEQKPINDLLNWKGRKPERVLTIARFFKDKGVETRSDLRRWLEAPNNLEELSKLEGIGNKTIDYLKKLAGIPNIAIDRYWHRLLNEAKISYKDYSEAKQIADLTAKLMKVNKASLDVSVWLYMRKKKNRGSSCSRYAAPIIGKR